MSTQGTLPLDFSQCQRWRHGREHYRPAGELFDPRYASVIVMRYKAEYPDAPVHVLRDGQELSYEAVGP